VLGINVPLWNHEMTDVAVTYDLFTSPTLLSPDEATIQPDGDSKLCLSCHDGTVAIGSVVNIGGAPSTISMAGTGGGGEMPAGSTNLGTDLSGHHPISIAVNNTLITDKDTQCGIVTWRVCFPPVGQPVKLRPTNNTYGGAGGDGVQCSSCHDPHNDGVVGTTKFLRTYAIGGGGELITDPLCTACHMDCSIPGGCP
jgi:hypothetical protein